MILFSESSTKGAPSNAFLKKMIDGSQELLSICHKLQFLMKYCAIAGSKSNTRSQEVLDVAQEPKTGDVSQPRHP